MWLSCDHIKVYHKSHHKLQTFNLEITPKVDVLVTTAGGIEEDFIKCLAPTYIGDFRLPGSKLRSQGLNRIGNLIAPNSNYVKFEEWVMPILDAMLEEQKKEASLWWFLVVGRHHSS